MHMNAEGQRSQVGPSLSACIIAQPVLSWKDRSVLLGVVECVNKRGGAYDEDDKTVLQLFASITSSALENLHGNVSSGSKTSVHRATQTLAFVE